MADLYRGGSTLHEIGIRYGVTRERIRQILTRDHGILCADGGQHVATARIRADRAAKKDQRYLAKHGCTFAQWCELRSLKKPLRAFHHQKMSAHERGIGWELTLWQWWTVWQESGHWHERGRGQGYAMCRKGDAGPYALGNIFFAPCFVNSSEKKTKKSTLPIGVKRWKNRYIATRMIRGKTLRLGTYPTASQASAAYWSATVTPSQIETHGP